MKHLFSVIVDLNLVCLAFFIFCSAGRQLVRAEREFNRRDAETQRDGR